MAVGREAPPVELEEAPLLPLSVVSEELSEVVLLESSDDEDLEDERVVVAVAFADELPAIMLETMEVKAEVMLPVAVAVTVGAAVMLAAAVASSER